jgi:hypothetical protein
MKTKEEIEQLASKRFTIKQFIGEDDYNRNETIAARCGYTEGYTQCQEDKKDKKYTEEDMFKCWEACRRFERPIREGYAPNFNEFINSLNKQD